MNYITVREGDSIKRIKLSRTYRVDFELKDGIKYEFIVHRDINDEKRWVISEPVSGYRVCLGATTKRKTIEDGEEFIKRNVNMELIEQAITDSKKKLEGGTI